MKKSYKLYGAFWDRLDVPDICPRLIKSHHGDNKFEIISLSEILKSSADSFENGNNNGKAIVINIDYFPKNSYVFANNFFIKRVLQIISFYSASINLYVCEDNDINKRVQTAFEDFYKRKTPERLLAQPIGVSQMIC